MVKDLFSKFQSTDNMNTKEMEPIVDVNDVSHISAGTVIKGEISSLNDIRIDGTVEGKIYSKGKIVVGENSVVTGSLLCTNVDFWGRMEGDIYVKDTMTLKGAAVVNGNINVRKFQVEMGAQINGSCHMISEADYEKFVADVVNTQAPGSAKAPKAARD